MPATRGARRAAARQQMAAGVPTYDGLGDDVQDCIVASMNVTSILTYGACSRAAQSAVNRWKAQIATLAGLGGVAPSGARVRVAVSNYSHHNVPPPADIRDFLTVCGIRHYDANAHSVTTYEEALEASKANRDHRGYTVPAKPLECTLKRLAVRHSTDRIRTAIVRLLKSAHAAGRGCGRPWIPTSRRALVNHVHAFPPLSAPWNFGIRPTEVFIRHRIEELMGGKYGFSAYAVVDEQDDELLYYVP